MAKVFIGIALVFMLATAGIGFMLKGNVDKLQQALTADKGKITAAEGKERAAKADADKAQKEAAAATEQAKAAEQTAAAKTQEAEKAKMDLTAANVVIDQNKMKIDDLEKKLADAKPGANPEDMAKKDAQIAELTTAKENAEKEKKEAQIALDAKVAEGKENEEKVHELSKKLHDREVNYQKPGLQGRVLAVNAGWNFVVLSVGDKQGVVINSTLLVVRGSEPIARLRITSVEPSTSIADVLPGTVRKGTAVQPGDTVIFEGSRGQAPQAPKSETAPTVPPITPTAPALPNS